MEEPESNESIDIYATIQPTKAEIEKTDYSVYTNKELEKIMQEALMNEEYEKAATIRDELNKRENK
ncbi:MAG: UvrB/UvrC motif-containing protein [Chitinophagales bacterium]